MYKELLKKVTNLGNPKILLAGDFMLDSYVYGDALRISPEAPVPVLKIVKTESHCGGAASVVADLAELGAKPICIGIIGNDSQGSELISQLKEINADTDGIVISTTRPTTCKQRLIGLAQHRHRQQLMRVDNESDAPLSIEEQTKLIENFKAKLNDADIVCLQDYNKAVLNPDICKKMIKLSIDAGKRVIVDPALGIDYAKYAGASTMTPNRKEASEAVGFAIETMQDADKAATVLLDTLKLEAMIITLDKDGAYLKTKEIGQHIPTIAKTVYDVTGAGDMVIAALSTSLAAGCNWHDSVEISNIAGGLEVEKFGVATVSIDEIVNEIVKRHHGKAGKIHSIETLLPELEYHRKQNEKIVFTNGCFDILHRGHIEYLKFTKAQGNIVVLGLNSDDSVRNIKGPTRPVNNQHDRAAVLSALESVDYITIFDEPTPLELIKKVQPDILIKGSDWKDKGVVGSEVVEARGGKVVFAEYLDGKSTTSTIEKMQSINGSEND